jgi:hypothetical protein
MDNLEKYIKDNLSAFDTEIPKESVWNAIEKRVEATDNIENFIKNNRVAFDSAMPPISLWNTIEKQIEATDNVENFIKNNRAAFDIASPRANLGESIESQLGGKDKVENYIQANREAFDTEIPSLKVWHNVAATLSTDSEPATKVAAINTVTNTKVVRLTWLRLAAAAVALLVFGVMIGFLLNQKQASKVLAQATEQVAPELQEAESFYNQKVQSKYTQLASFNPDPSVLADLKQLDEVQEELKKELQHAPTSTREEIVRRLIENYQIKLGILERVLNHIKEQPLDNQKSQQQHESI